MKDALAETTAETTAETAAGAPAGADAGGPAIEARAGENVGTICLRGPCALCGRDFVVQNGQIRLAASDRAGNRLGPVCFRCAAADGNTLRERQLSEAGRLRRKASRLERLVEGGIGVHAAARETASAARAGPKTGL